MTSEERDCVIHAIRLLEAMVPYVDAPSYATARAWLVRAAEDEMFDNEGLPIVPFKAIYTMDDFEAIAEDMHFDRLLGLHERHYESGLAGEGPLTREQQARVDAYHAYIEDMEREHEAVDRSGGRHVCERCGERKAKEFVTKGFDPTVYHECEGCGHVAM